MPTITVTPDIPRAYNLVEIDWSDQPVVEYARVVRVNEVTGECTPLRPYICFSGDYLNVSCDGTGVFWDTEVPLDQSVYYITEALANANCTPTESVALDTFTRVVGLGSWGNADIGGAWTVSGGVVGTDYQVNGTRGVVNQTSVNVGRRTSLGVLMQDGTVEITVVVPALATGATTNAGVLGRFMGAGDFYLGEVQFETTGAVTARLRKSVGGAFTTLTSVATGYTYTAGSQFRVKLVMDGSTLSLKVWPYLTDPEPTAFQTTTTDLSFPAAGGVGTRSILATGNTNVLPYSFQFDDLDAYAECIPCVPDTATSPSSTMPSNGAFRLRDPVRPCHDLYVPLCFTQAAAPECLPGSGIFFASMDTEVHDANSLILNPTNARYPLAVTRQRRGRSSVLTLVTRTFADRDELLLLNEPGSPLLLQGPPNYGIPDTYMSVGDISVQRGLSDHRFPVRINNLPFVQVARPAGPSQGVCGSRVEDTCDIYDTWAELEAEGFTWADLVKGAASNDGQVP